MTQLADFFRSGRGNVALLFGLAAPIAAVGVGGAVDYANLMKSRASLQSLADSAAIAGAQSLRLSNATSSTIQQTVSNVVAASTPEGSGVTVTSSIPSDKSSVTVNLQQNLRLSFGPLIGLSNGAVKASATARISGSNPLCFVSTAATDPTVMIGKVSEKDAEGKIVMTLLGGLITLLPTPGLMLGSKSTMNAPGCVVSTSLAKAYSISVTDSSKLTAAAIYSAGGFKGTVSINYSQSPVTDAPRMADPLAAAPQPSFSGCTYPTRKIISGGVTTLSPGVYCGGLEITDAADVTFLPGTYVIKDGSFLVDGKASIRGDGVGFFFTATNASVTAATAPNLYFSADSNISFSAPNSGAMAGFLIFQDRKITQGLLHVIASNNARRLHGTIYLPGGVLAVLASKPVADMSNYTIIVANSLIVFGGPQLVLNTNYDSTVPVPVGVGPQTGNVTLTR